MPRRKKVSAAITPANAKASPPAPTLPDQNPDQIASIEVSDVGMTRNLTIVGSTEEISRLMAAFGTKDRDFFCGLVGQIGRVKSRDNESASRTLSFLLSVIKNIQPRDELEAMLCSEAAKLDRFWLEFSALIPWLGGALTQSGHCGAQTTCQQLGRPRC